MNRREARRIALRLAALSVWASEAGEEGWHDYFSREEVARIRSEMLAISRELEDRSGLATSPGAVAYLTGVAPDDRPAACPA